MDTAHWPQGIGIGVVNKSMEDSSSARPVLERKARPQKDQALNCPRCNSTTTKFCYYNNYSLSQPRYFCKTCRRYWTEGGSLRNVPVGGGSRKNNKRSNSSSPSTSSAKKLHQDHNQGQISNFPVSDQNPKIHYQGQDLNLAYPPSEQDYENIHIDQNKLSHVHQNPSSSSSHHLHHFSAMELLKNGMVASRGLNSFVPMSVVPDHSNNNLTMFSAGFPMQEFKPSHGLSFSLDGFESGGFGCLQIQGVQESLKQQIIPSSTITTTSATATTEFDQHNRGGGEGDNISGGGGYWNGMLGGGSW